jgi:hypothetical protein
MMVGIKLFKIKVTVNYFKKNDLGEGGREYYDLF